MNNEAIGKQINKLANKIRRQVDNNVHQISGRDDAGRSNGWIIGFLANHQDQDVYQKDLEEAFCLTRSTVSKILDLMEKKGLVTRSPVSHDARLKKLSLTEKAYEFHKKIDEQGEKFEKKLLDGFEPEEVEQLQKYIQRLQHNIDRLEADERDKKKV